MKIRVVEKLKKDHGIMVNILANIKDITGEKDKSSEILQLLQKFKKIFLDHLKYEKDNFYLKLTEELKEKKDFTNEMKMIIDQMDIIAKQILDFSDKYNTKEKISTKDFELDFNKIFNILSTRVNIEEKNIYVYWA